MLDGPRRDAAEAPARQLVVLLHGYGADGGDLVPLTDEWSGALPHAAFAAPDAPEPHPALAVGRQWFRLVEASRDLTDARLVAAVSAVAEAVNTFANAELARLSLAVGRGRVRRIQPRRDRRARGRTFPNAGVRRSVGLLGRAGRWAGAITCRTPTAAGVSAPRRAG